MMPTTQTDEEEHVLVMWWSEQVVPSVLVDRQSSASRSTCARVRARRYRCTCQSSLSTTVSLVSKAVRGQVLKTLTMLVLTTGNGVNCFTLDREMGSWVQTQSNMMIPATTREFAINASNARHWHAPVKRYVDELLAGTSGPRGADFNMRWIASMVADVHRILVRGGIFMYPADSRDPAMPGKLRLMYEANPMAFIVEQAGGAATDGKGRILDIIPHKLHQRVPVFLGSKDEVALVTSYHQQ